MNCLLLPAMCSIVFITVNGEPAELKWKNYINRQNVRCLFPDSNYLWIGTHDAGLVRRNCITGEEEVFDKDEGFFSDQIITIVKDADNIIWAASPYNIASFRNGSWVVENVFDDNINGLTVDSSGTVWIACSNGIGRRSGGRFVKIDAFDSIKMTDEYPNAIVSGSRAGIVYVLVKNRVICFTLEGMLHGTIDVPFSNPVSICVDHGNRLFVAGVDSVGVYENDIWHFFSGNDSTLSTPVLRLSVSPYGDVWAYGGGDISVFIENRWELRYKHTYGSGIISTVEPLTKDSAWFGRPFFLALKTPDTLEAVPSSATPGGNEIKFVFADREGTIWTQAADDIGILRLIDDRWVFNELFYTLSNKTIKMLHTSDSVYWFLQPRDIKHYLLRINGSIQQYITRSEYIPTGTLYDFVEGSAGIVWFATSNGVVSSGNWMTYDKDNAGFASNVITSLLLRKDSTLWAGGNDGTLAYFRDSTWSLQAISIQSHITVLAEDSSGGLWIGTRDGVINKNGNNETVYTVSDGLGSNIVTQILVDKDNNVWVGTYNGLTCFTKGDLWQTFQRPCGIAGNTITSLCQNRDGILWIGTERGISTLAIGTSSVDKGAQPMRSASQTGTRTVLILGKSRKNNFNAGKVFLLNGKKMKLQSPNNIPRMIEVHVSD